MKLQSFIIAKGTIYAKYYTAQATGQDSWILMTMANIFWGARMYFEIEGTWILKKKPENNFIIVAVHSISTSS